MRKESFVAMGLLAILAAGCGGSDGGSGSAGSNKARFTFDCNIGGFPGLLELEVEAIGQSGITWGPGPNPTITGVIDTTMVIIWDWFGAATPYLCNLTGSSLL
jgi:hypothetical protein